MTIKLNNGSWDFSLDIQYDKYIEFRKDDNILFINVLYKKINIFGNIKQLATYLAIFIQGTFQELDEDDMVFDAFIFSTTGKIISCKYLIENKEVNDFINEYNNVYETVELLK